jgi:hypothetical protein
VSGAAVEVFESRAVLGADCGDVGAGHASVEGQKANDTTVAGATDIDWTGQV